MKKTLIFMFFLAIILILFILPSSFAIVQDGASCDEILSEKLNFDFSKGPEHVFRVQRYENSARMLFFQENYGPNYILWLNDLYRCGIIDFDTYVNSCLYGMEGFSCQYVVKKKPVDKFVIDSILCCEKSYGCYQGKCEYLPEFPEKYDYKLLPIETVDYKDSSGVREIKFYSQGKKHYPSSKYCKPPSSCIFSDGFGGFLSVPHNLTKNKKCEFDPNKKEWQCYYIFDEGYGTWLMELYLNKEALKNKDLYIKIRARIMNVIEAKPVILTLSSLDYKLNKIKIQSKKIGSFIGQRITGYQTPAGYYVFKIPREYLNKDKILLGFGSENGIVNIYYIEFIASDFQVKECGMIEKVSLHYYFVHNKLDLICPDWSEKGDFATCKNGMWEFNDDAYKQCNQLPKECSGDAGCINKYGPGYQCVMNYRCVKTGIVPCASVYDCFKFLKSCDYKCEKEEGKSVGKCVKSTLIKPPKPCDRAVWKKAPSCTWDVSKCEEKPECNSDKDCEKLLESCFAVCDSGKCISNDVGVPKAPCEKALWLDYPDCKYDTSNCDENKSIFFRIKMFILNIVSAIKRMLGFSVVKI